MIRYVAALIICAITQNALCQKRNAIWCFGDSAGIDFNNLTNPTPLFTGLDTRGSCVSIADTNGTLLFYAQTRATFGYRTTQVLNSNHVLMQNGDTIQGEGWYNELLIIPKPNSNDNYYLFSTNVAVGIPFQGLYYSVIDLSQNGGLGAVTQKNVQLNSIQPNDALQAIQHGNGRDWWIIFTRVNNPNNEFYFYLVTPVGVTLHHTQNIGDSVLISNYFFSYL